MPELTAEASGNTLYDSLDEEVSFDLSAIDLTGPEFEIPDQAGNPLYGDVSGFRIEDVTTGNPEGPGAFDVLMKANKQHLRGEYEAGLITSDQYAKAYIELTTAMLGSAVQLVTAREQAIWQNRLIQAQTRVAELQAVSTAVGVQTAKAQLALTHYEALQSKGRVALVKMELANGEMQWELAQIEHAQQTYRTTNMLPEELAGMQAANAVSVAQEATIAADTAIKDETLKQAVYETLTMQPAKLAQLTAQTDLVNEEIGAAAYRTANLLPAELASIQASTTVSTEQAANVVAETAMTTYRTASMLPAELANIQATTLVSSNQAANIAADSALKGEQLVQAEYETLNMQPARLLQLEAQTDLTSQEITAAAYRTANLLPAELAGLQASTSVTTKQGLNLDADVTVKTAQRLNIEADTTVKGAQQSSIVADTALKAEQLVQAEYETLNIQPARLLQLEAQTDLVNYQISTQLPAEVDRVATQTSLLDEEILTQTWKRLNLLPSELNMNVSQKALVDAQKGTTEYQLTAVLPAEVQKTDAEWALLDEQLKQQILRRTEQLAEELRILQADADIKEYQLATQLPAQTLLITEQTEAKHAETSNTRLNGTTIVTGMIGKQKELYDQQITSYQQDVSYKATKLWADSWIAQKTLDNDGVFVPTTFSLPEVEKVLESMREKAGLTSPPPAA